MSDHSPKTRQTGGIIFLIIIGLLLALVGSFFTWIMWRSYSRAQDMRSWPAVEAIILRSELEERKIGPAVPSDFRVGLLYAYQYEGEGYESENYTWRDNPWSKKLEKAQVVIDQFPEGEIVNAYVNPENPHKAVLKFDTKAPGYSIWFPIIFVLGGLGIIYGALFSRKGDV